MVAFQGYHHDHYQQMALPQPNCNFNPIPTLSLSFWLGLSYCAMSHSLFSHLSCLVFRWLVIYSKTSTAMLILNLTILTPKIKVKDQLNLILYLNINLSLNVNLSIEHNLNLGSTRYSTSEKFLQITYSNIDISS